MILKYFKEAGNNNESPRENFPEWTSDENVSRKAWTYVESAREERLKYIRQHNRVTDFSSRGSYRIKATEVARHAGVTRASLMHTSSYSSAFSAYLNEVNTQLEREKEVVLNRSAKVGQSRGSIRNSKDELIEVNARLKKRVEELELQNIEKMVTVILDSMPLPLKKKLGMK